MDSTDQSSSLLLEVGWNNEILQTMTSYQTLVKFWGWLVLSCFLINNKVHQVQTKTGPKW